MSRWIPLVFIIAFVAAFTLLVGPNEDGRPVPLVDREEIHGHAAQESMLAAVNYPHGVKLPPEVVAELEGIILQYPVEGNGQQGAARSLSQWELIGPTGMLVRGSIPPEYNSGRIRDIRLSTTGLRVAAASGGLWEWFLNIPIPLSDNDVTTQWIGSFDTHPESADIILIATGEPAGMAGTGVRMEVFDARGRRVRTLIDEHRAAGSHEVDFDGQGLASGVYHCRLVTGGKAYTQRMALIK